uniref:Uncharacterized protein n=1 Tax=Timema cristinae TaxID=61476 RepID=A0A7R9CTD6_TIMCR|nr:unnamed protein product [Timema cristinae]
MRCRLCELLTDQQLNVNLLNLQHNHHITQQNGNVTASPNMIWLPPFRDMMLAYLLRAFRQEDSSKDADHPVYEMISVDVVVTGATEEVRERNGETTPVALCTWTKE